MKTRLTETKQMGKTTIEIEQAIKKTNEQIAKSIEKTKVEKAKENLAKLEEAGGVKSNEFWRMKQKIQLREENISHRVIRDGNEYNTRDEIQEAYRQHYSGILKTRQIVPKYQIIQETIGKKFEGYMEIAKSQCHDVIRVKETEDILKNLKNNKAPGLDEITNEILKKGGNDIAESLTAMFNKILKKNKCPGEWRKVKIKSIYKNKCSKEDLNNQRGIFLTSNVQKVFERIILNRQYLKIDNSMSEFQDGARKQRSSLEHLYITRAIVDYYNYLNIPITMQFYDLEKCFDRLLLRKCMTVLWESGVRGPEWLTIYLMNKSAEIIIQTPVGETKPIEIQEL